MNRFFIDPRCIRPDGVEFPGEIAHQIGRVLRLRTGEKVAVLDNLGHAWLVELTELQGRKAAGRLVEELPMPEPDVRLFLYLCLSQREKFEWMLQKCTELGAAGFIPVVSSRSLVQEREDKGGRRHERWERILREAAEQSGRGKIPTLSEAVKFPQAVEQAVRQHTRVLIPDVTASARSGLKEALAGWEPGSGKEIGVFIGPEGGFSDEEVELARSSGCRPVDLGRRVLRMETAAVVATALVMYELGEMG